MNKLVSGMFAGLVAVVSMTHAGGALAQAASWNFGTNCDPSPTQNSYVVGGNTLSCTTSNPTETASVTAWSNIGTSGKFLRASMGDHSSSGIGVYSGTSETGGNGQHGFDNMTGTGLGGSQEFILVNFGPYKVDLTALSIGWRSGDADVSVLRWDGANTSQSAMYSAMANLTTGTLTNSTGWSLVGTESMNDATPDTSSVNLGGKVSSWWIISTYYGVQAQSSVGTLTTGDDKFKLSALMGNVCTGSVTGGNQGNGGTCDLGRVPEPGSLALAGLALVGVFASRRKVKALF